MYKRTLEWYEIRFHVEISDDCISKSLSPLSLFLLCTHMNTLATQISLVQLTQFFAEHKFNTNIIRNTKHFRRLSKIDLCDNKIVWHRTKILFFCWFFFLLQRITWETIDCYPTNQIHTDWAKIKHNQSINNDWTENKVQTTFNATDLLANNCTIQFLMLFV